jgi:hypothetical protein
MAALGDVMPTRKPTTRDLEMTLRGRIGSSGVISGKCRSDYLPFGRVIRGSRPPCALKAAASGCVCPAPRLAHARGLVRFILRPKFHLSGRFESCR